MTANELKQRYIYAVSKTLPHQSRKDVAMELDSLISDMAEAKVGGDEIDVKTMRVLLEELGRPAELAEKYSTGESALISQPYYTSYKFVLKIVLLCVGFGLIAAMLIAGLLNGQSAGEIILNILSSEVTALLMCFAIITLVFVVLGRMKIQIDFSTSIDDLPPVPTSEKPEIPKAESIAGIVFPIVFAIVFLVLPQFLTLGLSTGTQAVFVFNESALMSAFPLIIGFALLGIIRESFKLAVGRYCTRVMIVALITNILSAVLAVLWLGDMQLFTAEFMANMSTLMGSEGALIFQYFTPIFMAVLLIALAIDTIQTVVKTVKNKG